MLWSAIDHSRVVQILHNPRYAGAFVYGRNRSAFNAKLKPVQRRVPKADWQVLIPDAHEGYISWAEFERNQLTLEHNANGFVPGLRGRVPRQGGALLQGRVLCGRCGARMRVHYELLDGRLRAVLPLQRGGCAPRRQALPVGARHRGGRGHERLAARRPWRRRPSRWRWRCSRRLRSVCSRPRRCAKGSCSGLATRPNWHVAVTSRSIRRTGWSPTRWKLTGTPSCVSSTR